jgi:hypothetical protein
MHRDNSCSNGPLGQFLPIHLRCQGINDIKGMHKLYNSHHELTKEVLAFDSLNFLYMSTSIHAAKLFDDWLIL